MSTLRIATRGSDLALAQANYIAGRVRTELGLEAELVIIKTTGDRIQNVSLSKIGGKGLFIKEIEEALLDGRADVAIHSGKDLPAGIAPGLELVAFPERADPRDALVGRTSDLRIDTLREGARIGTGSTRRAALLLALRRDLEIVPLRGNVPTRIARLDEDDLDAVILACAGLDRLGRSDVISERISEDLILPAVCQGTLALECRADDPRRSEIERLDHPDNAVVVAAERAFLQQLQGDCTVPMACYCELRPDGTARVRGLVASSDGTRVVRAEAVGPAADADALGRRVAQSVLDGGGREILAALRAENGGETVA
jgi:hydroxymethylbilane synthase